MPVLKNLLGKSPSTSTGRLRNRRRAWEHGKSWEPPRHLTTRRFREVIANLEHAVGAQLLDRTPKGVVPTIYGRALLKRSLAAFDELRQGIRDIEFMSDPTSGELRLACPESVAAAVLPPVIERLSRMYPRVSLYVSQIKNPTQQFSELRERKLDLVLARLLPTPTDNSLEDLNVDVLFNDRLAIVVGTNSPWAQRRKLKLADLVDEPWVLTPPDTWNSFLLQEAFQAHGLPMPKLSVVTFSLHLRIHLLTTGRYITAFRSSVLRLIGIGGRLTTPPLPHHLAYGSRTSAVRSG